MHLVIDIASKLKDGVQVKIGGCYRDFHRVWQAEDALKKLLEMRDHLGMHLAARTEISPFDAS